MVIRIIEGAFNRGRSLSFCDERFQLIDPLGRYMRLAVHGRENCRGRSWRRIDWSHENLRPFWNSWSSFCQNDCLILNYASVSHHLSLISGLRGE